LRARKCKREAGLWNEDFLFSGAAALKTDIRPLAKFAKTAKAISRRGAETQRKATATA
jgi:hypothetical protein